MNKNDYLKRYQDQDTKTKVTYQSKIKDQDNIDVLMGRVVADDDIEMDYEPIFVETKESAFIDPATKKQLIANLTKHRSRSNSKDSSDSDSDSDSSDSDLQVQRQPRPQEIIFRDPKTGLRMTQEQKIEASKPIITDRQAIIEANKKRIQSWSKGIVQQQQKKEPQQVLSTEEHNRQVDLNLIKQFHFDDPMRQQIAEEDEQKITIDKHKFLLKCKFPSMPNRFDIQAGYRWDGVDRSNGYEQKFLEQVNEREDRHTRGRLENMKDL